MACDYFDIGILRPDSRMLLREAWTVSQIEEAIRWLRRENAWTIARECGLTEEDFERAWREELKLN